MPTGRNLTGLKFARLEVIQFSYTSHFPSGQKHDIWECKCKCGNNSLVAGPSLICGKTRSCGCLQIEMSTLTCKSRTTPGKTKKNIPVFIAWKNMIRRCSTDKNNPWFRWYGSRGIRVCDRWLTFLHFWNDVKKSWKKGLTLDRIDNNGNYEPGNVRWITQKQQMNNTRSNHVITVNGQKRTMTEWGESLGRNGHLIRDRIKIGWSN